MTTRLSLPVGVGVALVTMFDDRGVPDPGATAARARACVALGVSSVLVAGTTGEAARLRADDRLLLAEAVKGAVTSVPVIVGTGASDELTALEWTGKVAAAGVADSLLVFAPTDREPAGFFDRVRDASSGVPVLAYHNPALVSRSLDTASFPSLDVDGVKDSSADTSRLADLVELGVRVYVGSPTQLALAGGCGAAGALLALANVAPSLCIAAWNGDMGAQRALFATRRRAAADALGFLKATAPDAR